MLGGLFGSVCSIDITFDAEQNRKTAALGEAFGFPEGIRRQGLIASCLGPVTSEWKFSGRLFFRVMIRIYLLIYLLYVQ